MVSLYDVVLTFALSFSSFFFFFFLPFFFSIFFAISFLLEFYISEFIFECPEDELGEDVLSVLLDLISGSQLSNLVEVNEDSFLGDFVMSVPTRTAVLRRLLSLKQLQSSFVPLRKTCCSSVLVCILCIFFFFTKKKKTFS